MLEATAGLDHPSAELLRCFGSGELRGPEADAVEAHVETCSDCAQALRRLAPDPFLQRVRAAKPPGEGLPRSFDDYEILGEIARGGMGVVYRARQISLDRPVALKMIRSAQFASPLEQARFRSEAQSAASLDHPHIVPVHEVGEQAGQPYFSMKLIEGGSLADRLRQAGPPLDVPSAVRLIATVARAVHYAHQRGILHRDLKPANVLLDEQGQPHVTDFGLAKRLQGDHALTQTGTLLGTPSYVAPEQAAGSADVSTAADTWSLGAILYELLTGRPPFRGATPLETLQQAQHQPAPAPRAVRPDLPRDMEIICLKCLEKEPGRRYPSALALAEDLERFLASEPIVARPAGRLERARMWARRRPAAAALLGVSVLAGLALAGLSGVALWQWRTAVAALDSERKALARAEDNLKLAREAVDGTFNVARNDPLFQQPGMEQARKLLLKKALPFYRNFRAQKPDDPDLRYGEAEQWFRVGYIEQALGEPAEARRAFDKARDLCRELVEAHPDVSEYRGQLAATHFNLGSLLAERGERREALNEYTRARDYWSELVEARPDLAVYRGTLARARSRRGLLLTALGRRKEALKEHILARDLALELVEVHPHASRYRSELARIHTNLGTLLRALGRSREALKEYTRARDLLLGLVKTEPDVPAYRNTLAATHINLGNVLHALGRPRAALKEYLRARAVGSKLVEDHPAVPEYRLDLAAAHSNLGNLLSVLGRRQAALEEHTRARSLQSKLAAAHPEVPEYRKDLANTGNNVARLLAALGQRREARKELQQAHLAATRLVKAHPEIPPYRALLACTHYNTGMLLEAMGQHHDALKEQTRARDLQTKLVAANPEVPGYRSALADTRNSLGLLRQTLGKPKEALQEYARAHLLLTKLIEAHAEVPEYRNDLARTHNNRGNLLSALGRSREARKEFDRGRAIGSQLLEAHPDVPRYQDDQACLLNNLGSLLAELGEHREALKLLREAHKIGSKLAEAHPGNLAYRSTLAASNNNLGNVLRLLNEPRQALEHYRQARDLRIALLAARPEATEYRRNLAGTRTNLGMMLARLGKPREAIEEYRQARDLQRKLVEDHPRDCKYLEGLAATCLQRGSLLLDADRFADSAKDLTEGLRRAEELRRLDPRSRRVPVFLLFGLARRGYVLNRLGKLREADADWERALRLAPPAQRPAFRLGRAASRARAGDYLRAAPEADELGRAKSLPGAILYELACIHALDSASARRDPRQPLPVRDKRAEDYARQAVALLRRAAAAGYFRTAGTVPHLDRDDDLRGLRERDDYKRFRAGLTAKD
jgi:tetratricopeptide (TPR) repeat protein